MKRVRGFTLLELMIVVAVVAILAAVALSNYQKQVRKSRRAEGKQATVDLAMREEKYRSNSPNYATCDQAYSPATCATINGKLSYYTLAEAGTTGIAYVVTVTPKGDQVKDSCGTLTWTSTNGVVTKTASGSGTGCW